MFAFPFAHFYCAVRHLDLLVHHLYQQFSKTDLIWSSKPISTKAFTVKKILTAVVTITLPSKIRCQCYWFYGLNLQFTKVINRISLSDIVLIYQPIEVLISVLYLYNIQ